MPATRRAEDRAVEGRVLNWARWVRGGFQRPLRTPQEPPAVDLLDAEKVEKVMVRMKRHRPEYWRVVHQKWVRRVMDETGSRRVKIPFQRYRRLADLALSYIAGALDD